MERDGFADFLPQPYCKLKSLIFILRLIWFTLGYCNYLKQEN